VAIFLNPQLKTLQMNSNAYGTFWMHGTVVGYPVFSLTSLKRASRMRW
jgi:hypothetical protein